MKKIKKATRLQLVDYFSYSTYKHTFAKKYYPPYKLSSIIFIVFFMIINLFFLKIKPVFAKKKFSYSIINTSQRLSFDEKYEKYKLKRDSKIKLNSGKAADKQPLKKNPQENNPPPLMELLQKIQAKYPLDYIKEIQELLIDLGYEHSGRDGKLDITTITAIMEFQRKQGLVADGYPGPLTKERMEDILGKKLGKTTEGKSRDGKSGERKNKQERKPLPPEYVASIQRMLNKLGYNVPITGITDTLLTEKIIEFQREQGLVVDGIPGLKTKKAMEGELLKKDLKKVEYSKKKYPREYIKEIQSMLAELGYLDDKEMTGIINLTTYYAVVTFQSEHQKEYKLKPDGIPGEKTKAALEQQLNKKEKIKIIEMTKKTQEIKETKEKKIDLHDQPFVHQTESKIDTMAAPPVRTVINLAKSKEETGEISKTLIKKINKKPHYPSALFILIVIVAVFYTIFIIINFIKKLKEDILLRLNKIDFSIIQRIQKMEEVINSNFNKQRLGTAEIAKDLGASIFQIQQSINKLINFSNDLDNIIIDNERREKEYTSLLQEKFGSMVKIIGKEVAKLESDMEAKIQNAVMKTHLAKAYITQHYDQMAFHALESLIKLFDDLGEHAEKAYEIFLYIKEDGLNSIHPNVASSIELIPRYLDTLKKEKQFGFLVSDNTKFKKTWQKGSFPAKEYLTQALVNEFLNNPDKIKKLVEDKKGVESIQTKIGNDLILQVFGPFFCSMAEIQKKDMQIRPELNSKLISLRDDISIYLKVHFRLKPINISKGDFYDMSKHEITGYSASLENYKPRSIVSIQRWGYESTNDNKVIERAKVILCGQEK